MHGRLVRSRRSTALLYALSAPCAQWRIAALQACRNAAEQLDLTSRMCIQTMAVHVVDLPVVLLTFAHRALIMKARPACRSGGHADRQCARCCSKQESTKGPRLQASGATGQAA